MSSSFNAAMLYSSTDMASTPILRICLFIALFLPMVAHALFTVEARNGYFHPQSKEIRQSFKSGGDEQEVEVLVPLGCFTLWGNGGYFNRSGRANDLGVKAHLRIVPISAGIKFSFWGFGIGVGAVRPY